MAPVTQAQTRWRHSFIGNQRGDQRRQFPSIFTAHGDAPAKHDAGLVRQAPGNRIGMDHSALGVEQHHADGQAIERG